MLHQIKAPQSYNNFLKFISLVMQSSISKIEFLHVDQYFSSIFSPWKQYESLEKSLKSPWILHKLACMNLGSTWHHLLLCAYYDTVCFKIWISKVQDFGKLNFHPCDCLFSGAYYPASFPVISIICNSRSDILSEAPWKFPGSRACGTRYSALYFRSQMEE